jgi:predicted Rossmann-fold nucleotide-binding protein
VPFLLFGREFWERIIDWQALAEAGTISAQDLDLFVIVETAEEALDAIRGWGSRTERRETIPGRTPAVPRPGEADQTGDGS